MDWQKTILVTVLLALVAGGVWFLYRGETVDVAVPVRDLPAYTRITARDVKSVSRVGSTVPSGGVRKAADLIGRYTREPLSAGQAVRRRQIVPAAGPASSQGTVAVPLSATAAMAFGGRLRPGDEVALWSLLPPAGKPTAEGRLLLDHVLVLDLLPFADAGGKRGSDPFVIVLAVPVQWQAQVLTADAQQALSLTRRQ